jgi:hypothetical protein
VGAAAGEVERWQRFAAEQVASDERWRGDLEDAAATPLLDWALGLTESAVARLGAAGALNEDAAYDVAGAARAVLGAAAAALRGDPWDDVEAALLPSLGPPLFESAAAGAESVATVLRGAANAPATEPPAAPPAARRTESQPPPAEPGAAIWTTIPAPPPRKPPDASGTAREKPS